MASVLRSVPLVLCLSLSLTLIFSCSITTATVNLNQLQDGNAICGRTNANVECTTTTTIGRLVWRINNGPVVYNIDNTIPVNDNRNINGSSFVFNRRATVSGAEIYTSTASVDSIHVSSLQCSDGVGEDSFTIRSQVLDVVNYTLVDVSEDSAEVSWSAPDSAGVCCERYYVETPDGTIPSTTMTSYTLNVTTPEQRQNASLTVRCLDQRGTMGPEALYRLDVLNGTLPEVLQPKMVSPTVTVGQFCSGIRLYRANITIMELSFGNISRLTSCIVTKIVPDSVRSVNCSIEEGAAYFTSDQLISFSFNIRFTNQYGLRDDDYPSQFDAAVHLTACEITLWKILFGVFCAALFIYGLPSSVVIGILSYIIHRLRKPDSEVAVHYGGDKQEKDMVKVQ